MADGAMAWDPTPFAGWVEAVESWPWSEWQVGARQLGWVKSGTCGACRHPMAVYQEIVVYDQAMPEDYVEVVHAGCNCGLPHANRPSDAQFRGCGQQANVRGVS